MNLSTQLTLPGVHKKYTMGFRCWQCSCRFVDMLCTLRRSLLTQNEQKKLDMQQSCTVRHLNIKILQRKKKTFTILIFSFLVGAIVFLEKLTSLVSHEFKQKKNEASSSAPQVYNKTLKTFLRSSRVDQHPTTVALTLLFPFSIPFSAFPLHSSHFWKLTERQKETC